MATYSVIMSDNSPNMILADDQFIMLALSTGLIKNAELAPEAKKTQQDTMKNLEQTTQSSTG